MRSASLSIIFSDITTAFLVFYTLLAALRRKNLAPLSFSVITSADIFGPRLRIHINRRNSSDRCDGVFRAQRNGMEPGENSPVSF